MKTLKYISFTILLLMFFSCNNNINTNEKNAQDLVTDTLTTKGENTGNKIDYDKTKVLKSTYVIDQNGAEIKQKTDKNSETLGFYEYGVKLDVIEETKEWLGVRERITRKFLKNGSQIESTRWEKVYILKSKTGSINEIGLVPTDLNIITSLTINQKTEYFDTEKKLKDYLEIELIDKSLFKSKRNNLVDFVNTNNSDSKKVNGIITLNCEDTVIKYIDIPDAEENLQIFNYIGQVEFLNKYIISGSYYENLDYRFIDKTSGEETQLFGEYPNISPDKKHIICIYTNPYETTADLELYSINNIEVKHKISASFKYWMPTVEPSEMFWSTDGYLYLAVNHINSFWTENGRLNDECQYIRIKIL